MGKPYSSDLLERVRSHIESGHSCRDAARHFGIAPSTAVRLAQRVAATGSILGKRQGRPPGDGKLAPHMERLIAWVEAEPDITMPELASKLAAAREFCRHTGDGRLEIHNNIVERAMRTVAIGRKNWLSAGSDAGGRAAAVFYTLIETAKANGHNPRQWLIRALEAIARDRDLTDLDALMPWNIQTDSIVPESKIAER